MHLYHICKINYFKKPVASIGPIFLVTKLAILTSPCNTSQNIKWDITGPYAQVDKYLL